MSESTSAKERKALQVRLLAEGKKSCSKCRRELPLAAFSRPEYGWCRECKRNQGARYRKPTRLEIIAELEYILQAICWWPTDFGEEFEGVLQETPNIPALKAWADNMNERSHMRAQEGAAR